MIEVLDTKLSGIKLIKLSSFDDFRGSYTEIYNKELYKNKGIDIEFIEDDVSETTQYALKGLHGNSSCWKLISCLHGKFYLVVLNYNQDSDDFGKWQGFTLSDTNHCQVLVPPKYGNGHLCLSKKCLFHYKQSEYYSLDNQFSIAWNDPRFNIWWPIKPVIVSRRDELGDKRYVER